MTIEQLELPFADSVAMPAGRCRSLGHDARPVAVPDDTSKIRAASGDRPGRATHLEW